MIFVDFVRPLTIVQNKLGGGYDTSFSKRITFERATKNSLSFGYSIDRLKSGLRENLCFLYYVRGILEIYRYIEVFLIRYNSSLQ